VVVKGAATGTSRSCDPEGTLERDVSPTVPDGGVLVGAFALAAVLAGAVILVPFRLLRGRIAPAFMRSESAGVGRAGPGSDGDHG
jgi:hypothetical protein